MDNLILGLLGSIGFAVIAFPFAVIIRRPEKYHDVVRALQLTCSAVLTCMMFFTFGALYQSKIGPAAMPVDQMAGLIWIVFFIFLAYAFALWLVKRFFND